MAEAVGARASLRPVGRATTPHASSGSEDTRARVLASAKRQFGAVPYAQASVASIAREAGTSQPNVYTYFGSKTDLYVTAVHAVVADMMADVVVAAHRSSPPDVISAVLLALFRGTGRSDLVTRAFQQATDVRLKELIVDPIYEQIRDVLEGRLAAGQRSGALRADLDPATTAAGVAALVMANVITWVHSGRPTDEARRPAVAEVLRQAITAPTAPSAPTDRST